jgi:hypothetical protein
MYRQRTERERELDRESERERRIEILKTEEQGDRG